MKTQTGLWRHIYEDFSFDGASDFFENVSYATQLNRFSNNEISLSDCKLIQAKVENESNGEPMRVYDDVMEFIDDLQGIEWFDTHDGYTPCEVLYRDIDEVACYKTI